MTYFEFFSMLDRELGINFTNTEKLGKSKAKETNFSQAEINDRERRKRNWIKDGFSSFLDDYGEAHIGLNDIIDFLKFFDFDLGVKKIEDFEAQQKKKDNITPD